MVICTGKSCIPVNFQTFEQFFNKLVPEDKLATLDIKFDGRENVKSVFAKLTDTTLTLYTGSIKNFGDQHFQKSPEDLLILFTIYGVKCAGVSESFECKVNDQSIAKIKADDKFIQLVDKVGQFKAKYLQLYPEGFTPSVPAESKPVTESVAVSVGAPKKAVKASKSKSKTVDKSMFIPLENTPKIDCPPDLDLTQV